MAFNNPAQAEVDWHMSKELKCYAGSVRVGDLVSCGTHINYEVLIGRVVSCFSVPNYLTEHVVLEVFEKVGPSQWATTNSTKVADAACICISIPWVNHCGARYVLLPSV